MFKIEKGYLSDDLYLRGEGYNESLRMIQKYLANEKWRELNSNLIAIFEEGLRMIEQGKEGIIKK